MVLYALAYAASAALGVWESGRLRKAHIWESLPSRSRYRVAANVLFPVVLLSWLVLLLPPAVSLVRAGTAPSLGSLRLPVMGMLIVVAHAVVGFAIGSVLPRLIATPVVAVVDWVAVAFTRATQPYWIRHVSGQFADVGFGEMPRFVSVAAPVLLAGSVAAGLMLLWLPFGPRVLRAVLALGVAAAGVLGAQHLARDWPHTPPMATGQAPVDCTGVNPGCACRAWPPGTSPAPSTRPPGRWPSCARPVSRVPPPSRSKTCSTDRPGPAPVTGCGG